ncbi:MAG: proteasome subunit alpha [Verrucomicrobiota bacterium]
MTEEPYRWIEAIANRREYIENQLAAGSPITAVSCAEGVLFVTVSRGQQKLFEIYDRIAMGGIGHPGDIERLRMSAIEVASAEGFSRSVHDVSLRRMAAYSLSPVLKNAFEQIYGPPFLARMLFAELGRKGEPDLLLQLDYDGSLHIHEATAASCGFAVISGKSHSSRMMSEYLREKKCAQLTGNEALPIALAAWTVGHMTLAQEEGALPSGEEIAAHQQEQLQGGTLEAVLLDRRATSHATFRPLKR